MNKTTDELISELTKKVSTFQISWDTTFSTPGVAIVTAVRKNLTGGHNPMIMVHSTSVREALVQALADAS